MLQIATIKDKITKINQNTLTADQIRKTDEIQGQIIDLILVKIIDLILDNKNSKQSQIFKEEEDRIKIKVITSLTITIEVEAGVEDVILKIDLQT